MYAIITLCVLLLIYSIITAIIKSEAVKGMQSYYADYLAVLNDLTGVKHDDVTIPKIDNTTVDNTPVVDNSHGYSSSYGLIITSILLAISLLLNLWLLYSPNSHTYSNINGLRILEIDRRVLNDTFDIKTKFRSFQKQKSFSNFLKQQIYTDNSDDVINNHSNNNNNIKQAIGHVSALRLHLVKALERIDEIDGRLLERLFVNWMRNQITSCYNFVTSTNKSNSTSNSTRLAIVCRGLERDLGRFISKRLLTSSTFN